MEVLEIIGVLLVEQFVSGRYGVAFAGDLSGDALCQLADCLLVDQQVDLGLAQHVDESGSYD